MTGTITSLLLLALTCAVLAVQYPCTYTDSSGGRYDLSLMYRSARYELTVLQAEMTMALALTRSSETDYSIVVEQHDEVFYANVCGDTHVGCEADTHSGSCQLAGDGNFYPCGDASKAQWADCMCSRPRLGCAF